MKAWIESFWIVYCAFFMSIIKNQILMFDCFEICYKIFILHRKRRSRVFSFTCFFYWICNKITKIVIFEKETKFTKHANYKHKTYEFKINDYNAITTNNLFKIINCHVRRANIWNNIRNFSNFSCVNYIWIFKSNQTRTSFNKISNITLNSRRQINNLRIQTNKSSFHFYNIMTWRQLNFALKAKTNQIWHNNMTYMNILFF